MTKTPPQPNLETKQEVFKLLGARPNGSFGIVQLCNSSGLRWSAGKLAQTHGFSKAAIFEWKNSASKIMAVELLTRKARKMIRIKEGNFP